MTEDKNKGITSITYNQLHLPISVQLNGGRSISYKYDVAGNKIWKTIIEPGHPNKDYYYAAGGAVYEDNVLQFVSQEEGRVRPIRNAGGSVVSYAYDYMIKDNLGNVRIVLTEEQK
ncbi:MAG: hypothetical protein EOP10_27825, partial [Proteobacteria bacterium]